MDRGQQEGADAEIAFANGVYEADLQLIREVVALLPPDGLGAAAVRVLLQVIASTTG